MNQAVTDNPNMCSDCERLVFDDSPTLAASFTPETPAAEEPSLALQNMVAAAAHMA